MLEGYIKLWRETYRHPLHPINKKRAWTGYEAMQDLIMQAHYSTEPVKIADYDEIVQIQRGQIDVTVRQLAERWRWSLPKVTRYLKHHQDGNFLSQKRYRLFTVLTITNYELFNPLKNTGSLQDRYTDVDQVVTLKNKRIKEYKNNITPNGVTDESAILQKDENVSLSESVGNTPPVPGTPPNQSNPEINKILEALKQHIGVDDFVTSQKWQRIYGKHIFGLFQKLGKDEFLRRLESILSDGFKRKRCNDLEFLYKEIKAFIEPKTTSSTAFIS